MTTVTSLTADRMLAIEAASVVDGDVVGGNLILTKHDGSQINAGPVTGPTGPQGPQGALLPVISGVPVLDVGLVNQIRAGRQLTAADFTNMGLSAPAGLWNLSDLSDVSGNGRNLLNKGAVPFGTGINGSANTAAQFVGSTAQALYISDIGTNDPFRIRTGSWGCWFRTAKQGVVQGLVVKYSAAVRNFTMYVNAVNVASTDLGTNGDSGSQAGATGVSNVADDRWHFMVGVYDGAILRIYVDSVLEGTVTWSGAINSNAGGPLNIGNYSADSSTAGIASHYGRIDEAFITADVLSEDQIRNLYCAKIPHTLAVTPSRVSLNVHRRRKGATLAVADFPTQPLRLYNFSGGSLGDEGSNGVGLINTGAAVNVAGVDGSSGNAFTFNGTSQYLSATDTGLPSGLNSRSYGCWYKSGPIVGNSGIFGYGGSGGTAAFWVGTGGQLVGRCGSDDMSGPYITDGIWHHFVEVDDNNALDGNKRKLYVDGRLVGFSTVFTSLTLSGALSVVVGFYPGGGGNMYLKGQIDSAFICGYALTAEQIQMLYAKSSQTLASSPKNPGDHVEAMSTSNLLATFDTLESQHTIDLGVEP